MVMASVLSDVWGSWKAGCPSSGLQNLSVTEDDRGTGRYNLPKAALGVGKEGSMWL